MNYSEAIAKRVLEAILPGANLEYQSMQSDGEYDFDLRYDGGSIAAVEVTAAVDETLMKTVSAIRGKRAGGSVVPAAACKESWVIYAAKGAQIPRIRKNADQFLAKLEGEGINGFDYFDQWKPGCSQTVRELCGQLGVTEGYVLSSVGEPMIKIAFPLEGGAVDAITAVEAGEREAWKEDNREKLGAAKTTERHLVVYIDAGNDLPWTALTRFGPPAVTPKIPGEITNLWLIGHSENTDEFIAWFASTNEIWRSTKVVCTPETPSNESSHKMR